MNDTATSMMDLPTPSYVLTVALSREAVTVEQLAERLGLLGPGGELTLTRRSVHRLARAAWTARRKGLLVEEWRRTQGDAGSSSSRVSPTR